MSRAPIVPSEAQWRKMSPTQRAQFIDQVNAALSDPAEAMAEGRPHARAKEDALDALRLFFSRTGRWIYLTQEVSVLERMMDDLQTRHEEAQEGQTQAQLALRRARIEAILALVQVRGIVLTAEQQQEIEGCTDVALLTRWFQRAITAASAQELLQDT